MIIIVSQIAQISQYMFLNYHIFHKFLSYTSSAKKLRRLWLREARGVVAR